VQAAFKSLGFPLPPRDRILSGIGKVTQRFYQDLLPESNKSLAPMLQSMSSKNEVLLLRQGKGRLYPGTKKVLGQLKGWEYRLGLMSNSGPKYFKEVIQTFGLSPFFDQSLCAGEREGFSKKDLVRKISDLLEVEMAIVVGDRREDIMGAKENGIKSIGCLYGYGSREELEEADWKIERIGDLIQICSL
jgi:phosphoglycolate phosphatase